jgi:hypothetical protein
MSRNKNPSPTKPLTLSPSVQAYEALELLALRGLRGKGAADIALGIIENELQRLEESGYLEKLSPSKKAGKR